jgi:hypothetical protein
MHCRSDFGQPLGAPLQNGCRGAMSIEGGVRHLVARETSLAVGDPITSNEPVEPTQIAAAAPGMACAALLDCTVRACQRPRHQEMNVSGKKEGHAKAYDSYNAQQHRQTIADGWGRRLSLGFRRPVRFDAHQSPHHQPPAE